MESQLHCRCFEVVLVVVLMDDIHCYDDNHACGYVQQGNHALGHGGDDDYRMAVQNEVQDYDCLPNGCVVCAMAFSVDKGCLVSGLVECHMDVLESSTCRSRLHFQVHQLPCSANQSHIQ